MKLKRLVIPVLVFIMLSYSFGLTHEVNAAEDAGTIELRSSSEVVTQGSSFIAEVVVSEVTDLYGLQINVNYDSALVSLEKATVKGGYQDYSSTVIDNEAGEAMLPLLRASLAATTATDLVVAELQFKAKKAGEVNLLLDEVISVSSVSFTNDKGLKDLTPITLSVGAPISVKINAPVSVPTPSDNTGTDAPDLLQQLSKNINEENAVEALNLLEKLLADANLASQEQLAKLIEQLTELLQETQAVESVHVVQQGSSSLNISYNQANEQAHKLGVYYWNSNTSEWEYVRHDEKADGAFELSSVEPGIYAVIEYDANFTDIQNVYAEAKRAIEALTAMHLINGTGEGKFDPSKEITRAEFIALLARMLNLDSNGTSNSFADVPSNAWYADVVQAAKAAGIVQGDGNNFRPNDKLTREEMVLMLVNAGLLKASSEGADPFADDESISSWAKDAVYAAKKNGLLNGVGDNLMMPKANTKRADVAVILLRLIEQR